MKNETIGRVRVNLVDWIMVFVSICNLVFFLVSSDMFFNYSLMSLSARLLIVLNVAMFAIMMFYKSNKYQTLQLVIIVLMAFFMCLTYVIKPNGSLFDFVIMLLGYLAVPFYAVSVQRGYFGTSLIKWLRVISIVYAAWFIYRGYFTPTYFPVTNALVLGYTNPNTTGAYMFLVSILVLLTFDNVDKREFRIASYGVVALLLYLIIQTQCRTAFLLTTACLIYAIFPRIYRPGRFLPVACSIAPLIFYYLYLYLYSIGWQEDATLLDRTIYSGRQYTFVNEGMVYTLLGNLKRSFGGLNSALGLVNTLGIIGYVLNTIFYILFLVSPFIQSYIGKRVEKRNLALMCLCALLVYGCIESMMFTAGTVFGGMLGCILATIACNYKENYSELAKKYGY